MKAYVPISKVDKEKRMVYGYCSTEIEDSQGEIVEHMAIINAWSDYMEFANVREMHQPSAVGVTKESMDDNHGKWIGVKVVDDNAWNKVKEEVYKGFSIGGKVTKKDGNRIKEIELYEISLVDRPACEEARFEVVKFNNGKVAEKGSELIKVLDITINKLKNMEIKKDAVVEEPKTPEVTPEVVPTEENKTEPIIEEQKAEGDEKKDDVKMETPKEPEPAKAPNEDAKKSVGEVGMLADLARNCGYCIEYSDKNKAYSARLKTAMKELLLACGEEANATANEQEGGEEDAGKAQINIDLSKSVNEKLDSIVKTVGGFSEPLSKVDSLIKTVESLKERMDKVEAQPKADRPLTSLAVEKGFAGQDPVLKTVIDLQKEIKAIEIEIDANYDMAKAFANDTVKSVAIKSKTEELSQRFFQKKAELRNAQLTK